MVSKFSFNKGKMFLRLLIKSTLIVARSTNCSLLSVLNKIEFAKVYKFTTQQSIDLKLRSTRMSFVRGTWLEVLRMLLKELISRLKKNRKDNLDQVKKVRVAKLQKIIVNMTARAILNSPKKIHTAYVPINKTLYVRYN